MLEIFTWIVIGGLVVCVGGTAKQTPATSQLIIENRLELEAAPSVSEGKKPGPRVGSPDDF